MEQSKVRKELQNFMETQQALGCKRRDIALVLFARGYTERAVGTVMVIDPKSAAAMKVDNSKAGRIKWTAGSRPHLDPSTAQLKRVNGKKVLTKFIELVDKVLAESATGKGK